MDGRLLPCGDNAVLVEVDGLAEVLALQAALQPLIGRGGFDPVTDVVPAATTVGILVAEDADLALVRKAVRELLDRLDGSDVRPDAAGDAIELPVRYDGLDLDEVGRLTGLGAEGVVAAHTGTEWTVAFGGFAPGFGYLTGGDPRLKVPRRSEPRTSVPAGSVGLAGGFSGVYPRASPGGWQLLGRTDAVLWDPDRDPPALLQPGRRVRFRRVDALGSRRARPTDSARPAEGSRQARPAGVDRPAQWSRQARPAGVARPPGLLVEATGPLALFVDEGRPGLAAMGVGRSGAADLAAYRLGARLVGNPPGRAAVEVTFGGLRMRAETTCIIALTGADCAPSVDGHSVTHSGPVYLRAGQELVLGTPAAGLRCYLSIAGGFDVPLVLGSASTDTLSGLGPARLRAGDTLAVHRSEELRFPEVDQAPAPGAETGLMLLDLLPGPRTDWLADPTHVAATEWVVSARSDRAGVRLDGGALTRRPAMQGRELPSEPMVRGSVQVPADGRPVIFGADHPVTGGYPVVAVLTRPASDRLAQARPGQRVRFRLSWTAATT